MPLALAILTAVLSLWEYPSRYPVHESLRQRFIAASRVKDAAAMESVCRKGAALLPEDPTWRYNLACSLSLLGKHEEAALDELERAIDLGFRNEKAIAADDDLKPLAGNRRFIELLEYAKTMRERRVLTGPLAAMEATGTIGSQVVIGEQNLGWNFEYGCFTVKVKLEATNGAADEWRNAGDLYFNRDNGHSVIDVSKFPGLTAVRLDSEGRNRGMDLNGPNIEFADNPVFGNCSRAFVGSDLWRSLPRALMTMEASGICRMMRFYLNNQTWVYPANADIAPVGTNGDVFASITPYWITTAGMSYSDLPYVRAALEASRSFDDGVKGELVKRGLLAPTIQTLIRKSLPGVADETAYLSEKAHPTAFPQGGLDLGRMKKLACSLKASEIPPLAMIRVGMAKSQVKSEVPELTYGTAFAWAFVLRTEDRVRGFRIDAQGAEEFAFVQTHGAGVKARIDRIDNASAKVSIDREALSPTNRIDIAVIGRNRGTGWGAPSYVSFSRVDGAVGYVDPVLAAVTKKTK